MILWGLSEKRSQWLFHDLTLDAFWNPTQNHTAVLTPCPNSIIYPAFNCQFFPLPTWNPSKYALTETGLEQTILSFNKMEKHSVKSFSLPLLGKQSWCTETRAGSQLALREAWHKIGCHWRDEPWDFWWILMMSLPSFDTSEMAV